MPKLHYYNPGHETVVLINNPYYTPSGNVRKMIANLSCLPLWYAGPKDYVLVRDKNHLQFLSSLPMEIRPEATPVTCDELSLESLSLPSLVAAPWGITPQSILLFNELKDNYGLSLTVPQWKDEYIPLTARQTAANVLHKLAGSGIATPASPVFFEELDELEHWLMAHPGSYVIKTPYSSSGRGLRWIDKNILEEKDRNWIKGALKKQKAVSIEQVLDKCQDFAMEFYSEAKGKVEYKGLSVFGTSNRGAYTGNEMQAQESLLRYITAKTGMEKFQQISEALIPILGEIYRDYEGYMGIDMMVYKTQNNSYHIHPCVEINMRYTMGMAAVEIYQRYIHPEAKGVLKVVYEVDSNKLYEWHQQMKETCPLALDNKKIRKGYLSLCPVTRETNYIAYLVVA